MAVFPNMDNGEFPHIDTVNVNQWVNDFDYSRYDYTQMRLMICAVPWDMGEAHIGARTISGIGNVVYFGSKEKRDAWFDSIPADKCYRFETKYKELHRDNYIDIPLPFDIASQYNYLVVEYDMFSNNDSPVIYENADGHRKWFWFIREVEFLAPNTTRVHVLDDAFQTWIYDVNIEGMILERGHAPMLQVDVDDYLSNPIDNAQYLLADDVNYGHDMIARSESDFIFNASDMYVLFVTTSNVKGEWGSKADSDWTTPGRYNFQVQGINTYYVFAIKPETLSTFLTNVQASYPQFMQTVKAVAFVSGNLLTILQTTFTFADVTCYDVNASYKSNELIKLDKDMFAFPDRYSKIAKLYTYPYSYILLTDEQGNQTEIHIENTNGTIDIESTVSLVFPWLSINAHLSGIGKTARKTISFSNITAKNMPLQGNWYEYLMTWKIPTFGVFQDAGKQNDYGTFYDRAQQTLAAENVYLNVQESADTVIDNADLTASTNTAITTTSNSSVANTATSQQAYNNDICTADNTATFSAATATTQAQEQQAAISAAAGVAGGAVGALGSLATGNPVGAVASIAGGVIGGAATMASSSVAIALTQTQAGISTSSNSLHAVYANDLSSWKSTITQNTQTTIASTQNDLTTGSAANTAAMQLANGGRDRQTALSAIANQVSQTALNAPLEFGAWNNGDLATSRPMGLFANIVTQTDAAISKAGDEFLRYGYMYDQYWSFDGNWNIGKYYTYWKLRDFWVSDLNVPDMYMDKLRFFLYGGVTIWRKPEDIGKITPYQNI